MAVFINSDPSLNQAGTCASCFIGYSYKASTPEEILMADANGYVRQSAKLVAFNEQIPNLMKFAKKDRVDILVSPANMRTYTNRDGERVDQMEVTLLGVAGGAAAKPKTKAKPAANNEDLDQIFGNEDEIPF